MFHNKDECGYGTDLKNLETYTLEQAQIDMNRQDGSLLLLKSEVDKFAIKHVDMQYLDDEKGKPLNLDSIVVVQVDGVYDGNDIQFYAEFGFTFDLSKAKSLTYQDALDYPVDHSTIWSKSYMESISRDTFQVGNINKRKMITAGGVKYRTPRKSTASGRSRGNCPVCGQITWDYNPYENAYCKNHDESDLPY